ncbi:hypothetical protein ACFFWC_07360 [Plantactinospora siamensis]|uniref:Uncharacterized protein n=1 Tax=Plantactinospora siamensis TaxID=555372 RepID=A0ABV6NXK2_9ACTN
MSNPPADPSGNTEAFRAYVHQQPEPATPAPSRRPLIIAIAVAAVVVIALIIWLVS